MAKVQDSDERFELHTIPKPYNAPSAENSDYSTPENDFIDPLEFNQTTASESYTEEEAQTVVRKLDRRLVLFLAFLYMLSFLDRSSKQSAPADYTQYKR